MAQHGSNNELPPSFAPKEPDIFNGYPRKHFDGSLDGNSGNLDVLDWSFSMGDVGNTGAKASTAAM
jgi:hypothetical protein